MKDTTKGKQMNRREKICQAICKSGKFESGQGTCAPLCMDQLGEARRKCPHIGIVHGVLADKILQAIDE